jgi:hypothetical protein
MAEGRMTTDSELRVIPGDADERANERPRWRQVAGWVITALACLLLLFALIVPNDLSKLSFGAFLRIPVEAIVGAGLVLALPRRSRRVVAVVFGVLLGLLTIVKLLDMGFLEVLVRPFDLVLDWSLFQTTVEYIQTTSGRASAIGAVVLAVLIVLAVPVLMTLAALRLTRLMVERRAAAARGVVVAGIVWVTVGVLGAQFAPALPVASTSAAMLAYQHARQVPDGIRDAREFAAEAAVDPFRGTPGAQLLTGLRGKDVILVFVESYGRSAIEDPGLAPQVNSLLDNGTSRLRAAGFDSRSAFLTSSTVGGGSWLAHSTLLSGLWINNQRRYRTLVVSDRITLNNLFRRAGWRTVDVEPALLHPYPEGAYFGYDKIYGGRDLGYHGPWFAYSTMPDQYTMSAFQRIEHSAPGHPPVMAEITLLSSHAPWTAIPSMIDWTDVGDGSAFNRMDAREHPGDTRTNYRRSIEYSLDTVISWVQTYGDNNTVMVVLGDHQPGRAVIGEDTNRDVPITIVAHDPAVLDRISGWGWQDGLRPDPQATVWRMSEFRDRFLTAFGPQ